MEMVLNTNYLNDSEMGVFRIKLILAEDVVFLNEIQCLWKNSIIDQRDFSLMKNAFFRRGRSIQC